MTVADISAMDNPRFVSLQEKITYAGLRRAGMPDE
jgi:hypothetical protein